MAVDIAVLFARRDSVYKTMPGLDVFDEDRDARTYSGAMPVVAHPPCRGWGRLRKFAKIAPHELDLARFAVKTIRAQGGVLEHPETSILWDDQGMPKPGSGRDAWGGFSMVVDQMWWGHKARKRTWLYVCGVDAGAIPEIPFCLGEPTHVVFQNRHTKARRLAQGMPYPVELSKAAREHTPPEFATWLCNLARRCAR